MIASLQKRNLSPEMLGNLPKVTQLIGSRNRIKKYIFLKCIFLLLFHLWQLTLLAL